jgi:glycopeptide antibiotics resistance protein
MTHGSDAMKSQKRTLLPWILFVLYCAWMLLLLFDREQTEQSMNLEPLHTILLFVRVLLYDPSDYNIRLAIVNLFGNIIMFIPLGYFLPRLWKGLRKWWRTWLMTLVIMTAVELAQYFTLRGTCDVDDLILNLLGAAIGYGFFCIRKKDR